MFNEKYNHSDLVSQTVERQKELEVPGSNPATNKLFCSMLQRVTSNRVYEIPTKYTYN